MAWPGMPSSLWAMMAGQDQEKVSPEQLLSGSEGKWGPATANNPPCPSAGSQRVRGLGPGSAASALAAAWHWALAVLVLIDHFPQAAPGGVGAASP